MSFNKEKYENTQNSDEFIFKHAVAGSSDFGSALSKIIVRLAVLMSSFVVFLFLAFLLFGVATVCLVGLPGLIRQCVSMSRRPWIMLIGVGCLYVLSVWGGIATARLSLAVASCRLV